MSRAWLPNTLASSTPDTDRVSSVSALMAASDSCVERDTRRRRWPTVLVSQKKAGTVKTDTMVSCQLRMIIATIDDTNVTTLARMVEAVVVTTVWTPPTSLASRDWISPVLVFVKKASDSVSRWGVQPVAQVPHHVLPHASRLVGLQDPDRPVDDRHRGHDGDQEIQQMKLRPARDEQRLVEHRLDQQRVDDADRRGHHDQPDDDHHPEPVRPEQRDDPPPRVPARGNSRSLGH